MMKKVKRCGFQAGFTLVELMVAMVIGIFMVLALIVLLTNVNRNNGEMSKTGLMIENGRFAMYLLESDIAHAGFWGGFVPKFDDLTVTIVPGDKPTAVPDPCKTYSTWTAADQDNLIGIGVQGYEIPATVPSPTLPVCASVVTNPKANTDVLFVRNAENSSACVPGVASCPEPDVGDLMFQVGRCGDVAAPTPYVLAPYNDTASVHTLQQRDCTTTAELRRFVSTLYYIRNYSVTAGDNIPTLMRSSFGLSSGELKHKSAEALVEGVEGFRVEYGVDNISDSGDAVNLSQAIVWENSETKTSPTNRGDGTPDGNYIRCTAAVPCTADQLVNVVAVKIYILLRSDRTTAGYQDTKTYHLGSTTMGPFNDGYKRYLLTQTVRLNNVSSRRETP